MKTKPMRDLAGKGERKVSPARRAAFEILRRVEEDGAYASVLLAVDDENLRAEDRALSFELVMGVLRWQLWLDSLISHFANRSAATLDSPVRRSLRLAFYQLRFLSRVPPSAVVNEAVNLAHVARVKSAAGFINAVLRRALREADFDPAAGVTEEIEKVSIETSHPQWLIRRWVAQFGLDEARAFAIANNQPPPTAFRVVRHRGKTETPFTELKRAGAHLAPSEIARGAWRIDGAGAVLRQLAATGDVYIQDESSQLVADLLGAKPGEIIFDACAAPGSKATQLADMSDDSALLVAGDVHFSRLRLIRQAAERQELSRIWPITLDAANPPFGPATFDRVLVDAPCTGTGTLRRNPEIKWRITNSDVSRSSEQQQLILAESAKTLKPGGRLVYSTCSVETEENEEVVRRFLAETPDFLLTSSGIEQKFLTPDGFVRIWPHNLGADGFFAAVIQRRT
jgi:16S rRNA (cytosine967-C5)-methyltransferase